MCLAVIGRVVEVVGDRAMTDIEGNLITINIQLTPDVCAGNYVLIHAGFAIATVEEEEAFETQGLLNEISRVLDHAN